MAERLIDVEELESVIRKIKMNSVFPNWETMSPRTKEKLCKLGRAIRDIIEKQPTVDAAPVVHGRWEPDGKGWMEVCSNCGFNWWDGCQECGVRPSNTFYCPNCGAKMDLEA